MTDTPALWHHGGLEASTLHGQRLDAVVAALRERGARSVLDVGCGSGLLLEHLLAEDSIERLVGIDSSSLALAQARERLAAAGPRLQLHMARFDELQGIAGDFDAVTLVEVIEHIDPAQLSRLEGVLFGARRPATVLMTTPNAEWNPRLGLGPGQRRHPEHRFEWPRAKFRGWARGVAGRAGYRVRFSDIGDSVPGIGAATQMACFARSEPAAEAQPDAVPEPA